MSMSLGIQFREIFSHQPKSGLCVVCHIDVNPGANTHRNAGREVNLAICQLNPQRIRIKQSVSVKMVIILYVKVNYVAR